MDGSRYGSMCWGCRGFYWRVRQTGQRWLCNYCRFTQRPAA